MKGSRKLRVVSPCHADWAHMEPRAKGRHCGECGKTVVDLSRATRREVDRALEAAEASGARPCIRYRVDEHGTPVFAAARAGAMARAPVVATLVTALAGCSSLERVPRDFPTAGTMWNCL